MSNPTLFLRAALLTLCGGTSVPLRVQDSITVTYIGNASFALSDGVASVLTDYPYRSGAFGYMRYDLARLPTVPQPLLLISHGHLDHFDPTVPRPQGWRVLGPEDVTRGVSRERVIALDTLVRIGAISIAPIRTPHADLEHYSYRVRWNGRELFFTGDTEDPAVLLAQRGLAIAFVTPWLWRAVQSHGGRIDAKRVVIYHHQLGERVVGCDASCSVPLQGDAILIP